MTPKFFWAAPTYRVNVALIFSLEDQVDHNPEYDDWHKEYTEYVAKITNNEEEREKFIKKITEDYKNNYMSEYQENDTQTDINNIDNIYEMPEIDEYTINEYIYNIIGYPPEEEIHTYVIILQNGLKVEIAQDKFYAINDIIDKYGT